MGRTKRVIAARRAFLNAVHERAAEPEDTLTQDEVLDLFLDYRNAVDLTALDRLKARMPFSRACYDKPHRCPGRAGGGWRYAAVQRCERGYLRQPYRRRYWLGARCSGCGLYVLPLVTSWLDLTWWKYILTDRIWR
jgi:hypothetical protein